MPIYRPEVAVPLFLTPNASGHVHVLYLSFQEASDLMRGIVASVVKVSTIDASHSHSCTITWDGSNFAASIGTNHNHELDSSTGPIHTSPMYLSSGNDSPNPLHIHMAYLTEAEINGLVQGTVASVVKNSSVQASHVHSLTITYDPISHNFSATVGTNHTTQAHVFSMVAATYFGDYDKQASSDGVSSTTSGTFQTKVTMTTGNLPLGDYRIGFSCEIRNSSGGKPANFQARLDTTVIGGGSFIPGANTGTEDYDSRSGTYQAIGISGTHTIDIQYSSSGDTTFIRRARVEIWRMN